MQAIMQQFKTAFLLLIIFSLLTGIFYPLFITALSQTFFPWQANGSLLTVKQQTIGSLLIAQPFDAPNYFWERPSATTPPFNGAASSGSNLALTNPQFLQTVKDRMAVIKKSAGNNQSPVPLDLLTASGSGLDPEISPLAAYYQAERIARVRKIPVDKIRTLIDESIKPRMFFILGEPRVNVLLLNMKLDGLS